MELMTIGDELVIKVDCINIVHKQSSEYTELYNLTIIHCFSDFETYLCYVPLNYLYKFKSQFKIEKSFSDRTCIDSKFIGEFAVIVHDDQAFKKIKCVQGNRCISCHTFISYIGSNYTCYNCRQNPFPTWRLHND